jgi:hypothetical protein
MNTFRLLPEEEGGFSLCMWALMLRTHTCQHDGWYAWQRHFLRNLKNPKVPFTDDMRKAFDVGNTGLRVVLAGTFEHLESFATAFHLLGKELFCIFEFVFLW